MREDSREDGEKGPESRPHLTDPRFHTGDNREDGEKTTGSAARVISGRRVTGAERTLEVTPAGRHYRDPNP